MKPSHRIGASLIAGLGLAWSCAHDIALREYLSLSFWQPFVRYIRHFENPGVKRANTPFAGMQKTPGNSPLAQLRTAYQEISTPEAQGYQAAKYNALLAAAQADRTLTAREREEVELVAIKIAMRDAEGMDVDKLDQAKQRFQAFLKTAKVPEYASETRGWIAHIDYERGNRTAAGKAYFDELNRPGSNLGRETLFSSLHLTYGFNGGDDLLAHLEDYFDTPEHAAFAVSLATNRSRWVPWNDTPPPPLPYSKIVRLLEKHRELFRTPGGSRLLASLGMRVALIQGDIPEALKIANEVPEGDSVRSEPEFLWMLASTHFLSRDYSGAETPLMDLYVSPLASVVQKTAAAYGLCGVYAKTGNQLEQLRFALWLRTQNRWSEQNPDTNTEFQVYWASSGFDLGLILDTEASIDLLREFLDKYPNVANINLVKYALAVRLARENQYAEAADFYTQAKAPTRAARMKTVDQLYTEAFRSNLTGNDQYAAKIRFAEFLNANSDRVYFNDRLWNGFQREGASAEKDGRLTGEERERLMKGERKLRDDQEEYWRAWLVLRPVIDQAGHTDLGKKAARAALTGLRRINTERFGRAEEIRAADIELSKWLK